MYTNTEIRNIGYDCFATMVVNYHLSVVHIVGLFAFYLSLWYFTFYLTFYKILIKITNFTSLIPSSTSIGRLRIAFQSINAPKKRSKTSKSIINVGDSILFKILKTINYYWSIITYKCLLRNSLWHIKQ